MSELLGSLAARSLFNGSWGFEHQARTLSDLDASNWKLGQSLDPHREHLQVFCPLKKEEVVFVSRFFLFSAFRTQTLSVPRRLKGLKRRFGRVGTVHGRSRASKTRANGDKSQAPRVPWELGRFQSEPFRGDTKAGQLPGLVLSPTVGGKPRPESYLYRSYGLLAHTWHYDGRFGIGFGALVRK